MAYLEKLGNVDRAGPFSNMLGNVSQLEIARKKTPTTEAAATKEGIAAAKHIHTFPPCRMANLPRRSHAI